MKYRYQSGDTVYEVFIERQGEAYRARINGETYVLEVLDEQPGALILRFSGQTETEPGPIQPQAVFWAAEGDVRWLSSHGCTYRLDHPAERRGRHAGGAATSDTLRAPMPSQVRAVQVAEGDTVEAGQTLMLLEAMKMEIRLQSPRAGRIARLLAAEGQTVERDQTLVELEIAD